MSDEISCPSCGKSLHLKVECTQDRPVVVDCAQVYADSKRNEALREVHPHKCPECDEWWVSVSVPITDRIFNVDHVGVDKDTLVKLKRDVLSYTCSNGHNYEVPVEE